MPYIKKYILFIVIILLIIFLGIKYNYFNAIFSSNQNNTDSTLQKQSQQNDNFYEPSSSTFVFGLNAAFTDVTLKKMLADTDKYSLYTPLFSKYNIDHLRYPGGIPVRYYFWDDVDNNFANQAIDKIAEYYVKTGGKRTEQYQKLTLKPAPNNYEQFLNFSVISGLHPIIELNMQFYHDGDAVYPTALFQKETDLGLQADRWTKIQANLEAQIIFTHKILPGDIIWELGNEDYAMFDAPQYGDVVIKYTNIIKAKYPNDKVIAELSAGNFKTERKGKWNQDFVNYLNQNDFLSKIDYFAPHYYIDTRFQSQQQTDINTRIKSSEFFDYFKDIKSNFPTNYTPQFSVTEFAPLLHTYDNVNYNSQMHALLTWDELMKFHSDSTIKSVTEHGFNMDKNALFFDKSITGDLDYVDQNRQDSDVFAYIPPQAEAIRIFTEYTGDIVTDYFVTDNYEILVTETGTKKYLQILNYTETSQNIDITKYGTGTFVTYALPVLTNYYWDAEANKKTGIASGSISLPVHSFTTVIIN